MNLQDIIDAVDNHRIRISDHADEEREQDRLDLDEIYHTLKHGEIIEDYPEDKPFPSCLVLETGNNSPSFSGSSSPTLL